MNLIRLFTGARLAVQYSMAVFVAFGSAQLSACHESASTSVDAHAAQEEIPASGPSTPASVSGLNYTTAYIAHFRIVDADGVVGGGPNIAPARGDGKPAGGGKESCCVIVPEQWKKDMEVTVSWERDTHPDDEKDRTGDQWLTAVAKVPPYTSLTHAFWVRFLPNDRIVVQVNDQEWYIPKPVENESAYIVQGVLDEKLNKEMHQ